ncbi:signal peptidase I [Dongshaea marina]|uniref:signal peptidase I n=1 Tax=Dongshaea marina TaxID=2047966 RepID=UPI000D3EA8FF|nr:signal peptidase I [Dongshaea marina]
MQNMLTWLLASVTIITGMIWILDTLLWSKQRQVELLHQEETDILDMDELERRTPHRSAFIRSCCRLFPVIAFIFVIRSFVVQPYQVLGGSMKPTLIPGDVVLVNKLSYSLRDPLFHGSLLHLRKPDRGDLAAFRQDPSLSGASHTHVRIKRIVALPGDRLIYKDQQLLVQPACMRHQPCPPSRVISYSPPGGLLKITPDQGSNPDPKVLVWTVPPNKFFVMGDNKHNPKKHNWALIPRQDLIGKVFAIWNSFEANDGLYSWLPDWAPVKMNLSRVGSVD